MRSSTRAAAAAAALIIALVPPARAQVGDDAPGLGARRRDECDDERGRRGSRSSG